MKKLSNKFSLFHNGLSNTCTNAHIKSDCLTARGASNKMMVFFNLLKFSELFKKLLLSPIGICWTYSNSKSDGLTARARCILCNNAIRQTPEMRFKVGVPVLILVRGRSIFHYFKFQDIFCSISSDKAKFEINALWSKGCS